MKRRASVFVLLGGWAVSACFGQNPPIPTAYRDLYTFDLNQLRTFQATIRAAWNGQPYPVNYSAQLKSAAAENGTQLLDPEWRTLVINEISALQSLGSQSVTLHVDFPILDPAFTPQWGQYLAFYRQVIQHLRSRGLKVIIENQIIFPQPGIDTLNCQAYYDSLTWTEYENRRGAMAALIASQIQPDYLSVITEPDTEADGSGKTEPGTPAGSAEMLNIILTDIAATNPANIQVGAGTGTWLKDFQQFIEAYLASSVSYIDMHFYPVNEAFLPNAITIANLATAGGKGLAMSEAWLLKETDGELGKTDQTVVYSRNPWSFWGPLDGMFLRTMADFAQWQHMAFMAPFWTTYFHAVLDYASVSSLTPVETMEQASAAAQAAAKAGQITPTALAWEAVAVPSSDSQPPSPVTGLGGAAPTSMLVNLKWLPSTDSVGVLGYEIYRDGQQIATTANSWFSDSGVAPATVYSYSVTAYDAQGFRSPNSSHILVQTPQQ